MFIRNNERPLCIEREKVINKEKYYNIYGKELVKITTKHNVIYVEPDYTSKNIFVKNTIYKGKYCGIYSYAFTTKKEAELWEGE
jgi:hypothetical protein